MVMEPVSSAVVGEPTVVTVTGPPPKPPAPSRVAQLRVDPAEAGAKVKGAGGAEAVTLVSTLLLMVRFVGSSSSMPACPRGAVRSELPRKSRNTLPETSTNPPSPDVAPPRASAAPKNRVVSSDHTTAVPPLPLPVALASIRTPAATWVVCALRSGPLPCQFPPTRTWPPPAAPPAPSTASSNSPTFSPNTVTRPPVNPGPLPDASRVPLTRVTPDSPPSRKMAPLRSTRLVARTVPSTFSTVSSRAFLARALSVTAPPAASISPALDTRALTAAVSTARLSRPSPWKSSEMRSPAPRATLPRGAVSVPVLTAWLPSSTTYPPSAARRAPALLTDAVEPSALKA